MRNIEKV